MVRTQQQLDEVDALIIPGGESTTIGMLCERFGLLDAIRNRIESGMPVLGTCAGAILLSKTIEGSEQVRIGSLDMTIRRNAYGRQRESFEGEITLSGNFDNPDRSFAGVFIRAPRIVSVEDPLIAAEGTIGTEPVLVRRDRIWAATFHPELTDDRRVHAAFVRAATERAR